MDKHYFIKLLHKYLEGDLTIEEQQFLESYYNLFQNEPDVLEMLSITEKNALKENIKENIWNNIFKEEHASHKIRSINKRFIRLAAAAAIFIGILSSLFYFYTISSRDQKDAGLAKRIEKNPNKESRTTKVNYPKENRAIFLPDGSRVILSPGSKLFYPSSFDGRAKREVFLEGMAFFDVKHNASKLFIVHTGKLETIVLGTAFNIKAIPGENNITINVKRGKVRVSNQNKIFGILSRNEQITYDKEKVTAILKIVKNESYLDWKNQDLFIDNLTLSEASTILEEQYNVKIKINDFSISEQRFTTTFPKDEKLEQALNSICLFNGLSYDYDRPNSLVILKINK